MHDLNKAACNNTFSIGGIWYSADSLVSIESSVHRMKFIAGHESV
jgi:hypothetical protein